MERRREPRFSTNQPAEVTVIGESGFATPARVVDMSMHGIGMHIDQAIPSSSLVKVALEDMLLLCEVRYCRPEESGFSVGLLLKYVLTDVDKVPDLHRRLFKVFSSILAEV